MTPDQLARVREVAKTPLSYVSVQLADLRAVLARLDALEGMAEQSSRYEHELRRAAEVLKGAIIIGKVKSIGLLEVADAVQALIDERAEFVRLVAEYRAAERDILSSERKEINLRDRVDAALKELEGRE